MRLQEKQKIEVNCIRGSNVKMTPVTLECDKSFDGNLKAIRGMCKRGSCVVPDIVGLEVHKGRRMNVGESISIRNNKTGESAQVTCKSGNFIEGLGNITQKGVCHLPSGMSVLSGGNRQQFIYGGTTGRLFCGEHVHIKEFWVCCKLGQLRVKRCIFGEMCDKFFKWYELTPRICSSELNWAEEKTVEGC